MARLYKFWRFWIRKTEQERSFIIATIGYTEELLKRVNEQNLISIYIHGSFPRRDLRRGSDIDYVVITDDNVDLAKLKDLGKYFSNEYKRKLDVDINLNFYTITELRTGTFQHNNSFGRRLPPWKFIDHLSSSQIFYGQKLHENDFYQKKPDEKLKIAWELAAKYLNESWGDKEVSRLVLVSKFVMELIYQIENYRGSVRTKYIKKDLVKWFESNEDHIIHLLWQVIHNKEKYANKKERDRVFEKIRYFLKETKAFCGCQDHPDP